MKKMIAILSTISALGFAIALANAGDNPSTGSAAQGMSNAASNTAKDTAGTVSDKWKDAKSCTDESGTTFYKGKSGFTSCVDKMRKSEHSDQMGGTTPSDSSGSLMGEHPSDSTIDPSSPSGTSGSSNN